MTLNTVLVPVFPLPAPIQNVVMICYYAAAAAAAAAVRLAVARVEGVLKGKERNGALLLTCLPAEGIGKLASMTRHYVQVL